MRNSTAKLALAMSTALTGIAPAMAQDAGGGENDIVVTARRVEERLQDVPISITVFNQEQLSDRNVTNAQDLALYTPSLSATTNYGSENSTFAIRGFVQETGTGPSVGVYFADVVAPRGASQGFPAGDGAGPGAFFDLQNVQVLKGPQGTLFGRNTTGGAVLLVPQKPTRELEGYIEGSIGNYDLRRVQAVLNAPLADTFRVRLGVDRQKRDGYLKNISGIGKDRYADIDYIAARLSIVAELTPELENYTIASFTRSSTNGTQQKAFVCNPSPDPRNLLGNLACAQLAKQDLSDFYTVQNDMPDPYSKLRQWQVINTTTWQVNDSLTIKNIISYAQLRTKQHADLFGTNFVIPRGAFGQVPVGGGVTVPFPFADTPTGFAVIRNIPGGYSSDQSTFTEEFRLEGSSAGGALTWQLGAYYEDATPNGFIGSQSPVFIGCSDPDNLVCTDLTGGGALNYTAAKNTFKTRGVYAQGSYALTEQLSLTAGVRYTWDKIRSVSQRYTNIFPIGVPNASALRPIINLAAGNIIEAAPFVFRPSSSYCTEPERVAPACILDDQVSFKKPTWVLGIDFKPTPDILLYGKYSRGYRAGGVKSDVPREFVFFEPEKVDTFEVGAKTSFRGAVSGYFNLAGFYNNFSNQQIQFGFFDNPANTIPVTPTAGPVNVGKSRIWGIEIDAQVSPFEGFFVQGGYTYLNTKVKEVTTPVLPSTSPYVPGGFLVPGDDLAYSPKHKATITAGYTLPLDESVGKITFSGTYIHVGSQIANFSARNFAASNAPTFPVEFRGKDLGRLPSFNLVNLNLNWDAIAGSNFDAALFVTNLTKEKYFTATSGLIGTAGFDSAVLGEPRIYGARLRFRFGS